MRLYLAGPMRGVPLFNFPAFDGAAAMLRAAPEHHNVFNPAEHDRGWGFDPTNPYALDDFNIHAAMRRDLKVILRCHGIVLLNGWAHSEGAVLELSVAEAIGIGVYRLGRSGSLLPF